MAGNRSGNWVDLSPALPYVVNYISANRAGELQDAMKRQDIEAAQADPGFFTKLAMGADAYKGVPEAVQYIQRLQAQPELNRVGTMLQYPEFQGAEGLQELRDRPEFWTGKLDPNNPHLNTLTSKIANNAGTQLDVANGLDQIYKNGQIDPYLYARTVVNDAVNTPGKDGVKTNPIVDQIMKLAETRNTNQKLDSTQQLMNAAGKANFGPNEKLNALYAAAGRGVNTDDLKTLATTLGIEAKQLHYADTGAGQPGATVATVYDPNTGTFKTIGGVKQDMPRNTNVMVTNNLPVQETAFAKGVGEHNAKQYASAIETKANSEKALATIDVLKNSLKDSPSGWIAPYTYAALKRVTPNDKRVVAYEVAQNASQEMALSLLQNFKGAMSDKELDFVKKMAANPTMSRGAQARLIAASEKYNKQMIKKADTLIKSVEDAPVRSNINRTLQNDTRPPLTNFMR